jgi:hypothetical protein
MFLLTTINLYEAMVLIYDGIYLDNINDAFQLLQGLTDRGIVHYGIIIPEVATFNFKYCSCSVSQHL